LFRYSNWYSDVNSAGALTTRQFLDPTVVVGMGPALDGVALFGAILDVDAGFRAEATIFPKMWSEKDPSVVYTMSQSAPLFAVTNPNNTFKLITEDGQAGQPEREPGSGRRPARRMEDL
jgi:hypothetical protein